MEQWKEYKITSLIYKDSNVISIMKKNMYINILSYTVDIILIGEIQEESRD